MNIHDNVKRQTNSSYKDPEACGQKSAGGASEAETVWQCFHCMLCDLCSSSAEPLIQLKS